MNKNFIKELVTHSFIYSISSILARAIGFIMIPIYTRKLTPENYGIIELLDLFVLLAGLVLTFGIYEASFKHYYDEDSEPEQNKIISSTIILNFIVKGIFVLIGIKYKDLVSYLLFDSIEYIRYIKIIFYIFFLSSINELYLLYIRILKKSMLYSAINLTYLFVCLGMNVIFVVYLNKGVIGVLYSNLIARAIQFIILSPVVLKKVGFKFSPEAIRKLLRYGIPLVPASIGFFLISWSDRFFLQKFSNLSQLGVYALAYKFGFLINIVIVWPFSLIWDAKKFEIYKLNNAKEYYSKTFTYFAAILFFAFTFIWVIVRDLFEIMVDDQYFSAYSLVPFIAASYVLSGLNYYLRTCLYFRNWTKYIGLIVTITCAITMFLYYFLIKYYYAKGAAVASLLSFSCWTVLTYFTAQNKYEIKYEGIRIGKLVAISSLLIFLTHFINTQNIIRNIVIKTLLVLSFPFLLYVIKFFTNNEINLLKKLFTLKKLKIEY